jgi:hypothetical protein
VHRCLILRHVSGLEASPIIDVFMYPFLCYLSPLKTATDEDVGLERGDSCKEVGVRKTVPPLTQLR